MLLFLLLVYSSSNFIVSSMIVEPFIIGGITTDMTMYPFMVSIQHRKYYAHMCGGSYIAPKFILTAAHCIVDRVGKTSRWQLKRPSRFLAVAGASNLQDHDDINRQVRVFDKFLPHIKYRSDNLRYDIALCRIMKDFKLTYYVQFSQLPLRQGDNVIYENMKACSIAGWGKTDPYSEENVGTHLQSAHVPLILDDECRRPLFEKSQLCAGLPEGGVDSCQGDSGGPLVCNGTQVGLTSFGLGGCAQKARPGYYTRIDYFLKWINDTRSSNSKVDTPLSLVYFLVPFFFFAVLVSILMFYFKQRT